MDDRSVYRSVRTYVRRSVGRSVQCIVENGGSDPDAVWHHRLDGSRDEVGSGLGDRSTGTGIFGGEFEARHCKQWGVCGVRVLRTAPRRGPLPKLLWADLLEYCRYVDDVSASPDQVVVNDEVSFAATHTATKANIRSARLSALCIIW